MTPVFGLVLVACSVDLAAGLRRKSQRTSENQSSTVTLESVDCEAFSELTIKGKKVGKAAMMVCQKWPSSWGTFPLYSIDRAKDIFNHGFGEDGLWDQMKNLADERSRSTDFCWRDHASPDVNDCFEDDTFYKKGSWAPLMGSNDMPGQERTEEPTQLWCQKRCALVSGCKHFSYFGLDGGCHLQDADALPHDYIGRRPVAGPPVCPETKLMQSMSQLNASETWFGSGGPTTTCPSGFQPTTLIGNFAHVCSSRCQGSKLPVSCGFGCASSGSTCASTLMSQVTKVLKTIGTVAGYLIGSQVMAQIVNKVLGLVEFLVSTFSVLTKLAGLWTAYNEADSAAAFLTIFIAFIKDNAEKMNQNVDTLKAFFGEGIGFWMDMVDEGFKAGEINPDFVTSTMGKYGEAILDGAAGLVSVFVFPKCEV